MPATRARRPAPTSDVDSLPALLTRREVLSLLRICDDTLKLMADLPPVKLGRRAYRWRRCDVLRHLGLV